MAAISLDIAAMNVREIINQSMKKSARKELLNYVMNYYSSNQKIRIWGTAQSAVYLCRLIERNLVCMMLQQISL